MRGVVAEWQASGERQAGLCRERALAVWQFCAWKNECKRSAVAVFAWKRELLTDESVKNAKPPLYEQIERL